MYAARDDPVRDVLGPLSEAGRWAALAHVLDYDDLHLESTAHLSAVCVPAALAADGGARAYLAGAGVMARLGTALGWRHYSAGWHATCTAGAPGAAAAVAVARGLDADRVAVAMSLAVPFAGGVQRAFGTAAKSLQVAGAVEAGLRAATLAEAGASADLRALDDWMRLVRGDPDAVELSGPAVPGGLAVKLYPCCYALQRPIAAVPEARSEEVRAVRVSTPASALTPLIHHRPRTGLEGKFSLEYGIATALLDGHPGLESFSDSAVRRPEAERLVEAVSVEPQPGGGDLLAGSVEIQVELDSGEVLRSELDYPPGSPQRPPTQEELQHKLAACAPGRGQKLSALSWEEAPAYLRSDGNLPAGS
jgi:2-methylcitrate dehydratase PrpD